MGQGVHRLGEVVTLPFGAPRLFAQFDIQPTLLGRLAALLFRASELEMTVTLADGEKKRYRVVSGMAKAGFKRAPVIGQGDWTVAAIRIRCLIYLTSLLSRRIIQRLTVLGGCDEVGRIWDYDARHAPAQKSYPKGSRDGGRTVQGDN